VRPGITLVEGGLMVEPRSCSRNAALSARSAAIVCSNSSFFCFRPVTSLVSVLEFVSFVSAGRSSGGKPSSAMVRALKRFRSNL